MSPCDGGWQASLKPRCRVRKDASGSLRSPEAASSASIRLLEAHPGRVVVDPCERTALGLAASALDAGYWMFTSSPSLMLNVPAPPHVGVFAQRT